MKNLLCKIGVHKKEYYSAKYILMGTLGKVETWRCKRCKYKHKSGNFIPIKKIK